MLKIKFMLQIFALCTLQYFLSRFYSLTLQMIANTDMQQIILITTLFALFTEITLNDK